MSDESYMSHPNAKSIKGFCEALAIFSKYLPKGDAERYFMGGEHDEIHIYVPLSDLPWDSEDGKLLDGLGFHVNEDLEQWGYFT